MMYGKNESSIKTLEKIPENSIGVEIGVWEGLTSEIFLNKCKHLFLVDPWSIEPYKKTDEWGTYENYINRYSDLVKSKNEDDFQKYYDSVYENVCSKFKDKSVTIIRKTSDDFFLNPPKTRINWIYIDGSHAYNECLKDLINSYHLLKKYDGIILGDDYHDRVPGVKEAVNQFIKIYNLELNNFYGSQYEIRTN